jgi:hypothetical protein
VSNHLETDGPLIQPVYWQRQPNDVISLGQVEVEASSAPTAVELASVFLCFQPRKRVEFHLPPSNFMAAVQILVGSGQEKFKLSGRRTNVDVFPTRCNSDGAIYVTHTEPVTANGQTADIRETVCHLFNFPKFSSDDDYFIKKNAGGIVWLDRCGRTLLRAGGWLITIAATGDTTDICKQLTEQGGYAITHVIKIERENGDLYSSDVLLDLLVGLHHFLSFATGRWAGLGLPVAKDSAGNKVWEQWGLPLTARESGVSSSCWFDERGGSALGEVFRGYWQLSQRPVWAKSLREITYWYIRANGGGTGFGIDSGLIIAQAAIELLAWTHCVQDRQMVSAEGFGRKGLGAADKMRILASSLSIPTSIPQHLRALSCPPGKPWKDMPEALTTIRNSLVHPALDRAISSDAYYEAWNLAAWFIEMCLLRLCGYNGKYANRLKQRSIGEVESVPWAPSTTN